MPSASPRRAVAAAHRGERSRRRPLLRRLSAAARPAPAPDPPRRHRQRRRSPGCCSSAALGLWWRLASGPIQLDVCHALAGLRHRGEFRQPRACRSRRHPDRAHRERRRRGAHSRHRRARSPTAPWWRARRRPRSASRRMSLLSGHMRAESLNLVGAEMAVRIERDGDVTVFAGADKHPIATASVPVGGSRRRTRRRSETPFARAVALPPAERCAPRRMPRRHPQAARRTDRRNGRRAAVLDRRHRRDRPRRPRSARTRPQGRQSHRRRRAHRQAIGRFQNITLSLERPHGGGVVVTVGSDNPRPALGR